ncbi:hypothetical protein BpHYR1_042885 [Brachionus plicatilis]|uniref:Uncharacterized protein n=1 Tax=Brachionus plicatilis TaxID=10195 RepID=A0A3M7RKD3_BRAPC|nr:hypothetical protein BpHYR1_042885 [Brachionus plicatilis]
MFAGEQEFVDQEKRRMNIKTTIHFNYPLASQVVAAKSGSTNQDLYKAFLSVISDFENTLRLDDTTMDEAAVEGKLANVKCLMIEKKYGNKLSLIIILYFFIYLCFSSFDKAKKIIEKLHFFSYSPGFLGLKINHFLSVQKFKLPKDRFFAKFKYFENYSSITYHIYKFRSNIFAHNIFHFEKNKLEIKSNSALLSLNWINEEYSSNRSHGLFREDPTCPYQCQYLTEDHFFFLSCAPNKPLKGKEPWAHFSLPGKAWPRIPKILPKRRSLNNSPNIFLKQKGSRSKIITLKALDYSTRKYFEKSIFSRQNICITKTKQKHLDIPILSLIPPSDSRNDISHYKIIGICVPILSLVFAGLLFSKLGLEGKSNVNY